MVTRLFVTSGLVLGVAAVAFGQAGGQAADTPFQVLPITTLKSKDAVSVSNSGASSTVASPQNGTLCANVYGLSAETGQLIDCCSCRVAPNALVSIPIIDDLLGHPKPKPKAVVVKVLATLPSGPACDTGGVGNGSNVLATGVLARKGDTPFTPATLSAAELTSLNTQCAALHPGGNGCFACPIQ